MTKVKVRSPKTGKEVEFQYDLGKDLNEAVAKFGEDFVFAKYASAVVVQLQGRARALLDAGEEPEKVASIMREFDPKDRPAALRRVKNPEEMIAALLAKQTPEERRATIARLKEIVAKAVA